MSAPDLADMVKCRFITLYTSPGMVDIGAFEAFVWTQPTPVPQCDVDYVAGAIREAHAAGRNFYLCFRYAEPRAAMKKDLHKAGIAAVQAVLQ